MRKVWNHAFCMSIGAAHGRRRRSVLLAAAVFASACRCGPPPWLHAVRQPAFAGDYYPRDGEKLDGEVSRLLLGAPAPIPGRVQALLAPHASLPYCGAVLAAAYRAASSNSYDRVVVLTDADEARFDGAALPDVEKFGSSIGAVPVDRAGVERLAQLPGFWMHPAAFDDAFEVETQVPWIRKVFPSASLIPVVVGRIKREQRAILADELRTVLDERTLLVISSVLSWTGPSAPAPDPSWNPRDLAAMEARARAFDRDTLALLTSRQADALHARLQGPIAAACSPAAMEIGLRALASGEGRVVAYDTSGSYERSAHIAIDGFIGYGAAAFPR